MESDALDALMQSVEDILSHAFHTQHPLFQPQDVPLQVSSIACFPLMQERLGLDSTANTHVSYDSCLQCVHCVEYMQILSDLLVKVYRHYKRVPPTDTQKQAVLCTCLRALERVGGGIPQLQLVCYCMFMEHGLASQYLLLSDKHMTSPPVLLSLVGHIQNDILCMLVMNQVHSPVGCHSLPNARTLAKIASLCLTRDEDVLRFSKSMISRMSLFHNDPTILYHLCLLLFTHPNPNIAAHVVEYCRETIQLVTMQTRLSVQDCFLQYGYAAKCAYPDATQVPDSVWDHLCFLYTFLVNHHVPSPSEGSTYKDSTVEWNSDLYARQQQEIDHFWNPGKMSLAIYPRPILAILEQVLRSVVHSCRPASVSQILRTAQEQSPLQIDLIHWSDTVLHSYTGNDASTNVNSVSVQFLCHKEVLTYLSTSTMDVCMQAWRTLRLGDRAMSVLLGWVYASCPLFSPHLAQIHIVGRTVQVGDELAKFLLSPKETAHLELSCIQFATMEDCLEILSIVHHLCIPPLHDVLQKTLCTCIEDKSVDTLIERAQASTSHFLHHMCVKWCHYHPRPFGCNVYTSAMIRFFEDQAYAQLWVQSDRHAFFCTTPQWSPDHRTTPPPPPPPQDTATVSTQTHSPEPSILEIMSLFCTTDRQ